MIRLGEAATGAMAKRRSEGGKNGDGGSLTLKLDDLNKKAMNI